MALQATDLSQTIYALCSGSLPSAVGIIRVSGVKCRALVEKYFRSSTNGFGFQRGMYLGTFHDDKNRKIDETLLLIFPGPNSLTGEDVIEIQCHGSIAIVQSLEVLFESEGIRSATRGEFSYRALLNGKMSEEKLEELADVFLAREMGDLKRVYSRKDRTIEREFAKVREELIRIQAVLDTAVDFSDEYSSVVQSALPLIRKTSQDIQEIIHRYSTFRSGGNAPKLVIAGRPNAGKSSLFNALVGKYRAIVHERPGTTRDVIEEDLIVDGVSWKLVDTAGIRRGTAVTETEGIELGRNYLAGAQFWVLVVDGSVGLKEEDAQLLESFRDTPHLILWNKADLSEWKEPTVPAETGSVLRFGDMNRFLEVLRKKLGALHYSSETALPTSSETANLEFAHSGLSEMQKLLADEAPPEYVAERCRSICSVLGNLTGEVSREDVLDRIFNEFCIGK